MATLSKPEITLSLLVNIEATGGRYRALCPAIDVVSAGRSIDEALTNINEAVETRLEDWAEKGTLLDQLEQHSVPFVSGRTYWVIGVGRQESPYQAVTPAQAAVLRPRYRLSLVKHQRSLTMFLLTRA